MKKYQKIKRGLAETLSLSYGSINGGIFVFVLSILGGGKLYLFKDIFFIIFIKIQ